MKKFIFSLILPVFFLSAPVCVSSGSDKNEVKAIRPAVLFPASRVLLKNYNSGDFFIVKIALNSPVFPRGSVVREEIPDGWEIIGANPPWTKQTFRHVYLWKIPEKGERISSIMYGVMVPEGNKARKEFTGYIDVGKTSRIPIPGDKRVFLRPEDDQFQENAPQETQVQNKEAE